MAVTKEQLKKFECIVKKFAPPKKQLPLCKWFEATKNDVWLRVVSQVIVSGNSAPSEKLYKDKSIRKSISWKKLEKLPIAERKRAIWNALRALGSRYAGKKLNECRQTKALIHNFDLLNKYDRGPKDFLLAVSKLGSEMERIEFVRRKLKYLSHKGARDFLTTGFGLLKDSIALDGNILGTAKQIGLGVPDNVQQNGSRYNAFEAMLRDEVCRPLKLKGWQLDHVLFHNGKKIKSLLAAYGRHN